MNRNLDKLYRQSGEGHDYPTSDKSSSLADQIIRLYIRGKVSEKVMEEFLSWLSSDVRAEEKDEALARLWDSIDRSATRSTFASLSKVKTRVFNTPPAGTRRAPGMMLLRVAAVLVPVIALAGLYFWISYDNQAQSTAVAEHITVRVPNGKAEKVVLPDGSEVWVKGGSSFVYPSRFSESREVSLNGEAYFRVAAGKVPFVVSADKSEIRVLGTRFNLTDYDTDRDMSLSIENGSVEAVVNGGSYVMKEGQQLHYDRREGRVTFRDDTPFTSMETRKALTFEHSTLGEIFLALERGFGCVISVEGTMPAEVYTTRFDQTNELEDIMLILKELTGKFSYRTTEPDTVKVRMIR